MTVFEGASFALPAVSAVALEVCYTIGTAAIIEARVLTAVICI